jgi:threonine dehydrogenase-like Zn-dependent dehydrogenase
MSNLDISRHRELFDSDTFKDSVYIIGAGATGSWLALALAKLGIEDITVYDFDIVEEHNVPNQAFGINDIGIYKVDALYKTIAKNTSTKIDIHNEAFVDQHLEGIVFLMVDSMKERKKIWDTAIKMKSSIKLLIEPRMGIDMGRVYCVNPTDLNQIKKYEDTYYSDDVAEVSACGNTMTVVTTALGIASWCGRQLINFHNDIELDNEILIDFKYNNIVTTKW